MEICPNEMKTTAVRLQMSRLDRASRLMMTRPVERRRLKRAMRLRRLVYRTSSRPARQALDQMATLQRSLDGEARKAVSVFEALGEAMRKVPLERDGD